MKLRYWAAVTILLVGVIASPIQAENARPNIVIIFTDDQGYQDVGCFGAKGISTPNLDRMASEGRKFTNFYVAQAVCSASRAALLTGCYPNRIGIKGALGPKSKIALSRDEMTIAEFLKKQEYATGMVGKWHLGDVSPYLPTDRGFDEWFGVPYSHDMWPKHQFGKYPDLPLYENKKVFALNPEPDTLTTMYTERAVKFIEKSKDKTFFLYLAHNLPHVPLGVSSKFKGKSERGLYGDVIMEIDWSVGQVLDALKRSGVDENTLVVFTSDNGPWLLFGNHAGLALPLREGKATCFDGGVREPCIMRWPGKIPAGSVCDEMTLSMDLLPTIAGLVDAELPKEHAIDGKDIWPLITAQPGAKTPHEAFYYYWNDELQAIRSGKWKLHFAHNYPKPEPPGVDGKYGKYATKNMEPALFDLDQDISETNDVSGQNPEVVKQLLTFAERARDDLGDSLTQRKGRNTRPAGRVEPAADAK